MALETQRHIEKCPVEREPYYQTTGTEPEPPPWGEEILNNGDQLIYNYVPHHSVPYVILNSLFIFYQVRRYKFYLLNLSLLDPAQQTFYHGWKKVIDLQHFRMNWYLNPDLNRGTWPKCSELLATITNFTCDLTCTQPVIFSGTIMYQILTLFIKKKLFRTQDCFGGTGQCG